MTKTKLYNKDILRCNPLINLKEDINLIFETSKILLFGRKELHRIYTQELAQAELVSTGIRVLSKYKNGKYLSIPHLAELLKLDLPDLGKVINKLDCYFPVDLNDNANDDHVISYVKSTSIELNRKMTQYAYWILAPENNISEESVNHPIIPTLSSMPEDYAMLYELIKKLYEVQGISVSEIDIDTTFDESILHDNMVRIKNDIKQMIEDLIMK